MHERVIENQTVLCTGITYMYRHIIGKCVTLAKFYSDLPSCWNNLLFV